MSLLAPLLDVQEVDLASDAARTRSETLSERASVPLIDASLTEIDARLDAARSERERLENEESELAAQVTQIAAEIEAAEVERYSGKKFDRDAAKAHDESQESFRRQKTALEEREMELLESLEGVEVRIETEQAARAANRSEAKRVTEAIQKVEAEVASELARLDERRTAILGDVPKDILSAYERVRAQPRSGGRAATALAEGRCGACAIKLPSHEYALMKAEPDDALIQCPQCRRVLVR